MSTTMRRKLERLQSDLDEIKPVPPRPVRLIAKPGPDATETERKAYAEAVAWSKAEAGTLIVLTPLMPLRRQIVDGVMIVDV